MYYTYIFVVYIISGRLNLAFIHALFLEGDGHLWAIPQEIVFYLLWPWVVFLIVMPLRRFPKITMLALLLAVAAWNRFVTIDTIWLLGMDHVKLPLFFGVFLTGAFFSFLYSFYLASVAADSPVHRLACSLASPLGLIIILFFLLFSTGHIIDQKIVYSQQYVGYYGFLAGFLIFCIVLAKGKILDKVLTLAPLRELGVVGLSLYLVHPLVKKIVDGFSTLYFDYKLKNFSLFLATLVCSYALARYTYIHIERPGFQEKPGS
jgi:peptidoglycan/LPS O-acetylase OafA/YrhL